MPARGVARNGGVRQILKGRPAIDYQLSFARESEAEPSSRWAALWAVAGPGGCCS